MVKPVALNLSRKCGPKCLPLPNVSYYSSALSHTQVSSPEKLQEAGGPEGQGHSQQADEHCLSPAVWSVTQGLRHSVDGEHSCEWGNARKAGQRAQPPGSGWGSSALSPLWGSHCFVPGLFAHSLCHQATTQPAPT